MRNLLSQIYRNLEERFYKLSKKARTAVIAAACLLLFFAVWESPWERDARLEAASAHKEQAEEAYRAGSSAENCGDEAIMHMREAIRMDPRNISYRQMTGIIHFQCNEFDEAIENLKMVVDAENIAADMLTDSRFYLAKSYLQQKNPDRDKALEYLEEAVRSNPNFTGALQQLGDLQFQTGKYESAINNWKKVISSLPPGDPFRADFHNRIAEAYYKLKKRDGAKAQWKAALSVDPSNKTAKAGLKKL